jgi:hypothetical protein
LTSLAVFAGAGLDADVDEDARTGGDDNEVDEAARVGRGVVLRLDDFLAALAELILVLGPAH